MRVFAGKDWSEFQAIRYVLRYTLRRTLKLIIGKYPRREYILPPSMETSFSVLINSRIIFMRLIFQCLSVCAIK